ncbi:alpha/beta hydrolase family protein [Parafilimonas sp.]|uniref:alpha/beta hydrolase family protein n=1 Tax=Parafilimonas sp. TaxID=1969739 RepID=UPI0039E396F5
MGIASKLYPLADQVYDYFTIKRKCSVALPQDLFDDKLFSVDEFFNFVQPFFNQPELFYTMLAAPQQEDIVEIHAENNETLFAYPSPAATTWQENNTAYFKLFSSSKPNNTLLLFAPGWARQNLDIESKICRQFLNNGIDSCLLIKPFHQQRTPANLYSGELFISPHIFLTIMNFRQFVAEIRFLINHFRKQYQHIGIIGMSSGGFQAGLAIDVEPVDFYFPIITGARLGTLTWQSIFTKYIKQSFIESGIDEDQLNKAWAVTDQYYLGHNCKAKYIKQFISLYDKAVATECQYLLNDIYGNPDKVELKCAHNSIIFYFDRIIKEIVEAVKKRG